MWTKIAFKNVRKSVKEYAIYFLTLVFAVAIFYMFNSIYAQQELMDASKSVSTAMEMMNKTLGYVSIVVAVILGFLIVYANNFFMKRRKKELGLYMTLGMRRGTISAILVLETSLLAAVALVTGLIVGVFLSQFMSVFTAKLFEINMLRYRFIVSGAAVGKSMLYFGLIFLVVAVCNVFAISRFKLIDLLYGARKNETLRIKDPKVCGVLFALAVAALATAYAMVLRIDLLRLLTMGTPVLASIIGLGIVGTLLFFYSGAGLLTSFLQKREGFYYRDLNMFTLRQLASKINTNFVVISVISLVLFLTAGIFSTGYSLQKLLSKETVQERMYDYSYYYFYNGEGTLRTQSILEMLPENLKDNTLISSEVTINTYRGNDEWLPEDTSAKIFYALGYNGDYMTLSDYNKVAVGEGKEPITLEQGTFTIVNNAVRENTFDTDLEEVLNGTVGLTVAGQKYQYVQKENLVHLDNSMSTTNVIVPDELVKGLEPASEILSINCKNAQANSDYYDRLQVEREQLGGTQPDKQPFSFVTSRIQDEADAIGSKAMISFLAIYVGIVFMITCAAILAIQQLSEAADNKVRYELLQKLGTEKSMINKALFSQIAAYFVAPLTLAILHFMVAIKVVGNVLAEEGGINMTKSICLTAVFMLALYATYFILTYFSAKNVVNKK